MSRFKSFQNWAIEKFLENAIQGAVGFAGGFLTAYSAKVSNINFFENAKDPFFIVIYFFIGAFLSILFFYFYTFVQKKSINNLYAKHVFENSKVNVLKNQFNDEKISITEFFDPYYIPHTGKIFINCTITGPALLFCKNISMTDMTFRSVQIVIVKDNQGVFGAVALENCTLRGGSLRNVTLLMNRQTYNSLPAELRQHVPVINE